MKKTIISILLLILVIITIEIIDYLFIGIESSVPEEIKNTCSIEQKQFMGRNIFILKPSDGEKTNKKILYFHGGSYVAKTSQKHWEFIEQIVKDTGITIILPDYPLTPKYTYKDVFEMVTPLYKEIIDRIDVKDLIVMGDSAGGGIALALEEKIGEENSPMPNKTILISPWLDVRLNNPQIDEIQKIDKQLNKESLKLAGIAYSGEDGINNYLVNPIEGDLSKLKNVIIITGTQDILNPDVEVLRKKAEEQGTKLEIKEYVGAPHIWMIEKNTSEEMIQQGYQEIIANLE